MSLSQVHLVICSSFLSLANKAEFLDLGYVSTPSSCRVSPPHQEPILGTHDCHLRAWQPVTWRTGQGSLGLPFPPPCHHLQTLKGPAESLLKGQQSWKGT